MDFKNLPKIDLHCHLDGSLALEMIQRHTDKIVTMADLQVEDNCRSLVEYLDKFQIPIECIQDGEALEDAAYTFIKEVAKENTKYIEVRFAPMSSVNANLTCEDVIESVLKGLERGKKEFAVRYNVIVCAMRHQGFDVNSKMLRVARGYLGDGVCALDLAGDEMTYPVEMFQDLFRLAKELDMPYVIHAGETGSLENVRKSFEYGAKRIGHGIALRHDKELMKEIGRRGTGIEMCPTSNLQTKAIEDWGKYPLMEFIEQGIKVSINTDNRTVSNTNMTKELQLIYERFGQEEALIRKLLNNAVETSFAKDVTL
ncbi:adenosine deaminase [Anaerosporobacter sp.]|uniref:adenosine deaminase n=1 Tax=Anaerosporobacter sp. TaxID=1872529 RepID=UPI00286EBF74|nr:adenosine deaminase [Anaerosporobacter sp.]